MKTIAKVEDTLLTATQVAALTGWSEAYIARLLKRGQFPQPDWQSGVRTFRRLWKRSTIEKYLAERDGAA
jgi:predicted DNA-binding transcriptional regulator AlpA